jgi:hypothetical protein
MTATITASTVSKQSPVSGDATEVEPVIKLEAIVSREEFAALEHEWDDFLSKTQTPSPFQSWDYLDVWWTVYGQKGYDVKFYVARDSNGQLIGAAPLMISQKDAFPGARGRFRHLALMGGVGEMAGESLELPALAGYEQAIGEATADLISQSFKGLWDVVYFYLVPEKSSSVQTMLEKLSKYGITTKTTSSLPSPYLPVESSWDDHMKTRSSKFARKMRYIPSCAIRRYAMKQLVIDQDISLDDAMGHLVRLANERWGTESKAFHTPEFIDFHKQLAPRFFAKGRLSFGVFELNGEVAAAAYNFIFDDKMWGYQCPWDTRFKAANAGNILHIWSAKTAFDMGLRELDTLPGNSGSKDEWTSDAHMLNIYEGACPGNLGGALFKIARKLDRLLKQKP